MQWFLRDVYGYYRSLEICRHSANIYFPKTEAGIRNVVIPHGCAWIIQKLRNMSAFCEYIFFTDGHRINTYSFRNRLRTVCKNTGCVQKSPHKIRKTYCTILLDHSVDNQMVISQMGHSNISCSETYYHRDRKNLQKKQKIMDSIDEFMVVSRQFLVIFLKREQLGNKKEHPGKVRNVDFMGKIAV